MARKIAELVADAGKLAAYTRRGGADWRKAAPDRFLVMLNDIIKLTERTFLLNLSAEARGDRPRIAILRSSICRRPRVPLWPSGSSMRAATMRVATAPSVRMLARYSALSSIAPTVCCSSSKGSYANAAGSTIRIR
jgi:hypothetical protein